MKTKNIIEDEYNKIDSQIKAISGIRTITGPMVLLSIGNIERFDSILKLRVYSGMDSIVKQSGDYNITLNISKSGTLLIMYVL